MKSTVEKLSPTRVRINVEVPFTELEPDIDRAFKQLAKQVRLPGFRPGKAPRKLLEARVGRGAVLEQVVDRPMSPQLAVAALDAIRLHYRDAQANPNLYGRSIESQLVGSVGYQARENLKVSADLSYSDTPLATKQTMGLVRVEYRFGFAAKGGK